MFASVIPSPFKVNTVSNIVVVSHARIWLLLSVVTLRQVKLIDPHSSTLRAV